MQWLLHSGVTLAITIQQTSKQEQGITQVACGFVHGYGVTYTASSSVQRLLKKPNVAGGSSVE